MLTAKQHELLMFIDRKIQETGVSPSFDEMKEALGLKSKSGIHRLITALEERGFLRRLRHRARALEVVKLPENAQPRRSGFQPNVIEGGRRAAPPPMGKPVSSAPDDMREIQLLNTRIAAGLVKETVEAQSETIHVPGFLVSALGEHYAMKVDGDSMTGLGINDGDTVIVQRTDAARNNEVVVAYIHDEQKATLKTLRMRGDAIALEAANPKYETQIFGPGQVSIQGRLVALMRAY